MPKRLTLLNKILYVLAFIAVIAGCTSPTETEVPTATFEVSSTPLPSATPTPSSTSTPVPTATLTLTPQPTPTFTITPIPATRIPIIEYHDPDYHVGDQVEMTPQLFSDQMTWLASNGYHTLSAEELVSYVDGEAIFPQKTVVLTFDIGLPKRPVYQDVVIPTLQKFGFKAIFFILSNSGVEQDVCKDGNVFCWDDFRTWAQEGVISIASHGLYHPDFKTLTPTGITQEMTQSRQILIDKTGQIPLAFAFPFDSVPNVGPGLAKAAGYQLAMAGVTSRKEGPVVLVNDPDRYSLPRVYPYSSVHNYPKLNGYNLTFGDVVTNLIQPRAGTANATPAPTQVSSTGQTTSSIPGQASPTSTGQASTQTATPAAALNNVDQVLQICAHLPTDTYLRAQALMRASFTPDVSAEARAKLPGFTTNPSCNFYGGNVPEAIVVHYTVGDLTSSEAAFRQDKGASSQYIIDRDGKVVQMVPEGLGALHVNCNNTRSNCLPSCPICDGKNGELTEPYTRSIGIELVNRGHLPGPTAPGTYFFDYLRSYNYFYWDEYPDAQIAALKVLVEDIAARWNIPIDPDHVLGHYRINEKVDPGPALNLFWSRAGYPPKPPIFNSPEP